MKRYNFFGLSNNIFISEPFAFQIKTDLIRLGPIASQENYFFENYNQIKQKNYNQILQIFSKQIKSYISKFSIKNNLDTLKEIALAINSAEIELELIKDYKLINSYDEIQEPVIKIASVKNIKIKNNLKIPKVVDQLANEKISAKEAIKELQEKQFDNYYLTKAFSIGAFGIQKKIVPTKWSITAIDVIMSNYLLEKVKEYPSIDSFMLFYNSMLHNSFFIILLPGNFEFELFEITMKLNNFKYQIDNFTYDHEYYEGKKDYSIQAGGYYAVRLAISEYLEKIKKQAKVIALRFIYPEYQKSLGVWNVRENVRDAMNKKSIILNSKDEMLSYLEKQVKDLFSILKKKSVILTQKRLTDF
ncbi:MAG: hypothetical protein QW076_03370 [Candidatus Anstonellales archaeon]